jgi:hypothetical protein
MPSAPLSLSQKAYIAPFAVFMAMLIVADFLPPSARHWIYPLQTVLCGAVLIKFWSFYRLGTPKKAGFSLFIAVLVLLLWISPQVLLGYPGRFQGFDPSPFKDRATLYYAVVVMRFIRLVVAVPLVEEIFWRGFLLRYLIRDDFESVPFGTFSRFSFSIVTLGFCLEHQFADWPVALVSGALFNLVAYRTRNLTSCVLAHAVTNLLLGIYIMRTSQWGFW